MQYILYNDLLNLKFCKRLSIVDWEPFLSVIFSQKHKQDRLDIYKISMIEMARMQMTILNDPYNPNTWFNIL